MKMSRISLLSLLTLTVLFSCARVPQRIVEVPEERSGFTVIRVEGRYGAASGFFVEPDKIATNIHVVAHPGPIFIKSPDKKKIWTVEGVTAFDVKNDLAILKIAGKGTPSLLGDSDAVAVGDTVIATGYPGGKYKVTEGAVHRVRSNDKWLQMQVALSGGSSGSPVQDSEGQIIGIVSAVEDPYSYVIPSNTLRTLMTRSGPVEPLTQWRKREPIRAYIYSVRGQRKYNANHYDQAIADFDKAIKLYPQKADAYYNRGLAKFTLGDFEFAQGNLAEAWELYESGIEDSTQAIELTPEDVYAYHNRAGGKFRLGQSTANQGDIAKGQQYYQGAIQDWTQVIKLNPELADPYNNLGIAKAILGESKGSQGDIAGAQELYAAAIADCTQAMRLNPAYAEPYINRGYAQFRLGKTKADHVDMASARELYTAAVQDFTEAIQLDPGSAYAYGNRGVVKAALGNTEEAIQDFDAAIRINPEYTEIYYDRGRAKAVLGQDEAAQADFEKAKALNPKVEK
ncbi:tetratricopeptide repeat protein [Candidatus Poribacteria bacterium]|nr:tetratricopeptide repeat protein [Candidatus Poribacteria bacterium]